MHSEEKKKKAVYNREQYSAITSRLLQEKRHSRAERAGAPLNSLDYNKAKHSKRSMRIIKDGGWRDDGAVRELTIKLGAGRSRRRLHRLLLLSGYKHTRQTHRSGGRRGEGAQRQRSSSNVWFTLKRSISWCAKQTVLFFCFHAWVGGHTFALCSPN